MSAPVFIPHNACTVASGDCFVEGRCLFQCQTQLSEDNANKELTESLDLLKQLHDYVLMFRSVTRYVDGSQIDGTVKRAGTFLKKHDK